MIGGNPQNLARAERRVGLDSWSIVLESVSFAYLADEIYCEKQYYFCREIKRWKLLWRALYNFDVIHFNFGQSIMPTQIFKFSQENLTWKLLRNLYNLYAIPFELIDLPLLKYTGKKIFVTYQGNDARQGDYCKAHFDLTFANEVEESYYSSKSDQRKRKRIDKFAKYADRIFALNPDLLYVLPDNAQFLPYAHVDLEDWATPEITTRNSLCPLVVHAPSHRRIKGTQYILEAVSRLKTEGINFDFVLVEGKTNAEARGIYEKADLLVDQLFAGWYGGVAVELMALGKPVVCYIREHDLQFIPSQMRQELPIINATPKTIYAVLREWLTIRKDELPTLGQQSRNYVEKWHNPVKIANYLKSEYETVLSSNI
jgi:hypothetical protein